ncbi:MAG TPA: hypothetical protein VGM86_13870 [Thermoanaerobaculia bacterium]|jgi:hypothetical protein
MTADDLDRILASEEPLIPSSGFAAATMERVRESASAPPPLPFPWHRFLLGLLVMLALSGLGGWAAVRLHAMEALGSAFGYVLADPHLWLPLAGAGVALAGTYLLVGLTLGFTGASR